MKKLPKIYQSELNKVHNNREVFDSLKEKNDNKPSKTKNSINYDTLSVREKIKELINQNSYIFNTKVKIIINNTEKECQIAGVVNNHIITMDNEIIKIEDIKDIKILS